MNVWRALFLPAPKISSRRNQVRVRKEIERIIRNNFESCASSRYYRERKLEIVWKIWSVEEDNLYDERKEKEERSGKKNKVYYGAINVETTLPISLNLTRNFF